MTQISTYFGTMLKFQRYFSKSSTNTRKWSELWGEKTHSIVRPGKIGPLRHLPASIERPSYISQPLYSSPEIVLKTRDEIAVMHDVCKLARKILNLTSRHIEPGVTTDELDRILHELVVKNGAYPSPLEYKGFPKSCCTSVNNVALHGIPDDRPLQDGDIINLDVTVYKHGFHGDLSETYAAGAVDDNAKNLISATKQALNEAVSICGPGVNFAAIGSAIQQALATSYLTVIPQICGHGIGRVFHEAPDIFHVDYDDGDLHNMRPGMVFTIEPCVSEGGTKIELLSDGWTYVSTDGSRSAQFEHTIAITDEGYSVLTADNDP